MRSSYHPTRPQSRKAFETYSPDGTILPYSSKIQPAPKADRRLRHIDESQQIALCRLHPTRPQSRKAFETPLPVITLTALIFVIHPAPQAERRLRLVLPVDHIGPDVFLEPPIRSRKTFETNRPPCRRAGPPPAIPPQLNRKRNVSRGQRGMNSATANAQRHFIGK